MSYRYILIMISKTLFQIYGGGHFKVNTSMHMNVHHLLAVYSGGILSFNGAGFQPAPVGLHEGPHPGHGML